MAARIVRPFVFMLVLSAMLAGAGLGLAQEELDAAGKKLLAAAGLFDRGMYKPAAQEYTEFLTLYPRHAQASAARYGLAVCHYRLEDHAACVKLLDELVKDKAFAKRDEALAVLGHSHIQLKQYDKSLAALDELAASHPDSPHAMQAGVNRIQVLYARGDREGCLKAAEAFLAKHAQTASAPAVQYCQALALAGLDRADQAADVLARLLAAKSNLPFEADALLLWGQCLEKQSKLDEAAEVYRKLGRLSPARGQYSLALVQYKLGKYAESVQVLRQLLKDPAGAFAAPARLQLGLGLLAENKIPDARAVFADIVKSDPARAPSAQYWLAQCDLGERKYRDAITALDELAKARPAGLNPAEIGRDRAVCLMELDRHAEAADAFDAYRRAAPQALDLPAVTYRQAFCLHKVGKYDASNALCAQVPADGPLAVSAAELTAENLFLMGKSEQASQTLARLAETAKTADQKLRYAFRLGQCEYLAGRFEKAAEHLQTVAASPGAATDPTFREALFLLGDCHLQLGRNDQALAALDRYCRQSKNARDEAHYKLALAQARTGATEQAERTLARLVKGPADSPWVQRGLLDHAQLLYNQKQSKKAQAALNDLLEAKPDNDLHGRALYLQAWIDYDAKQFSAAAGTLTKLTGQFPKHPMAGDATYLLALCLRETGKGDQAVTLLEAYVKNNPQGKYVQEARTLVASSLAALGKGDEAVKRLAALAADKAAVSDQVLYQLAWAQRGAKADLDAAATYRRLLAEYADSKLASPARVELAELLCNADKHDLAADLLEKALAGPLEEKLAAPARYRLGVCQSRLNQPEKAAATFLGFADKHPSHELEPAALYQAGMEWIRAGKLGQAEKPLAAVVSRHPRHELAPAAQLKLGEVQAERGDFEQAGQAYQAFLQRYPGDKFVPLAQFGLGWSLENRKQYEQARACYAKVVASHNGPTAARAQFQTGETYFAQQQYEKAAQELLKVDIVYAYPEWSARALLEAGRAFQQLKQPDQAKAQFTLCAEKYKDRPEAALARRQLESMKKEP